MFARAFFLALLLVLSVPSRSQNSCAAPALGHPCAMGGIATQGWSEPGLSLGIGNPVHLATGNKYQQELDLPATPSTPLLQVVRHYNSLDPRHGSFGRGWSLSYDTRLYQAAGRIQIVQADGSRVDFIGDPRQALHNRHGSLEKQAGQWLWSWPDGRNLRFDSQGRLVRISVVSASIIRSTSAKPGPEAINAIDIIRHTQAGPLFGTISHIVASAAERPGAALHFHYLIRHGRAYVSAIDTPRGRFNYRYESESTAPTAASKPASQLTAVQRPDRYERRYTYEAAPTPGGPGLLGRIAIASPDGTVLPLHTWTYDTYGRAITSERHQPKQQAYALRIQYARAAGTHQNGLTLVHNANGQQTRFEFNLHNGRPALLKVEGARCPGCAAPGSTAGFDTDQRLFWLNNNQFVHDTSGRLRHMYPRAPGWPGLRLDFDLQGRRTAWHTPATGTEKLLFDDMGRPAQRQFANGDSWHYRYDEQGRPIRIIASNENSTLTTRLSWQGALLATIRHPHENEFRRHDSQGRLTERRLQRPLSATPSGRYEYIDRFDYDAQHRLTAHHLPEGGALHYERNAQGHLTRIVWHDTQGHKHTVIQAWNQHAGYDYGNGLSLALHYQQSNALALSLYDKNRVLWDHFRAHDRHNRPAREADQFISQQAGHQTRYAYDPSSRLTMAVATPHKPSGTHTLPDEVVAQPPHQYWYAWKPEGDAAATRHNAQTLRPAVQRDSSGLPQVIEGLQVRYGPHRRLEQVRQNERLIDHYRHNAFGHRIQTDSVGEHADYFYLDNQLVAEARYPKARDSQPEDRAITHRYIYAGHALVGMIDYSRSTPTGVLYAVHSDLMGAPRMITDAARQIRWLAEYTPAGQASRVQGDLDFRIRLPGQISDPSTGWHDNLLRTYHPRLGHYLEPDPLGPLPGTDILGYAAQQPRRYIDPMGLLLFAFDGTRQNERTRSNVWLLSQRYQDGPVFYHSGPGNPYYVELDALAAHTAPQIIETQWQHLLNALHGTLPRADQPTPIDIIGYSRGAALARHFGNFIGQHIDQGLFSYADPLRGQISACVDLRFMGLFDTVAQFGLNGQLNELYDFSIASTWGWVAHAVALHERRWLFPLVAAADGMADNVVEAPFAGAHSDIGGGIPAGGNSPAHLHGDLSDISLNWMLWQARAASVSFSRLAAEQTAIDNPIIHDARSSLARSVQEGDRRVDNPDGSKQLDYQDEHQRLGRQQRDATEALIDRYENWRRNDDEAVGIVDLDAYARWLEEELGWRAPALQTTSLVNHAMI